LTIKITVAALFRLVILFGVFGWIITGCVSDRPARVFPSPVMDQRFVKVLEDGIAAYEEGKYKQASIIFQDVIARYPGSPHRLEAQWMLGQTYERQGRWKRALLEYESLLSNFSENPHAGEARIRIELLRELLRHAAREKDYPVLLGITVSDIRFFQSRMMKYRAKGYNTLVLDTQIPGKTSNVKAMIPFISMAHQKGFYVFARIHVQTKDLFEQSVLNDLKHHLIDIAVTGMDGVLFDGFSILTDERFDRKTMERFLRDFEVKLKPERVLEDPVTYWRWVGWRSREVMRLLKETVVPILNTRTDFYWGIIFPSEAITAPHYVIAQTGLDLLEAKRHGVDYFGIRSLDDQSNRIFLEKAEDLIGNPKRIIMVGALSEDDERMSLQGPFHHGLLHLTGIQ
jgi:hypothetical protein